MIILKNQLFSCEPCIWDKKGQSCYHVKDRLISLRNCSQLKLSSSKDPGPNLSYYRLQINKLSSKISTIYRTAAHKNSDILFNKELNVNLSKSVGPYIFILSNNTNTVIVNPLQSITGSSPITSIFSNCNLLVKDPFSKKNDITMDYDDTAAINGKIPSQKDVLEPVIFRLVQHVSRGPLENQPTVINPAKETFPFGETLLNPISGIDDPTKLPGKLPGCSPKYGKYPEIPDNLDSVDFKDIVCRTEHLLDEMKERLKILEI